MKRRTQDLLLLFKELKNEKSRIKESEGDHNDDEARSNYKKQLDRLTTIVQGTTPVKGDLLKIKKYYDLADIPHVGGKK